MIGPKYGGLAKRQVELFRHKVSMSLVKDERRANLEDVVVRTGRADEDAERLEPVGYLAAVAPLRPTTLVVQDVDAGEHAPAPHLADCS